MCPNQTHEPADSVPMMTADYAVPDDMMTTGLACHDGSYKLVRSLLQNDDNRSGKNGKPFFGMYDNLHEACQCSHQA